MRLRIGYEIGYDCPKPTPMILSLHVHYSRVSDLLVPDQLVTRPPVPITAYRDGFGNWCSRIVAPKGTIRLTADALIRDSGLPDPVVTSATEQPVQDLPGDVLVYLLGSRYCETDLLSQTAWSRFEHTPPGWARVQAISEFVHGHLSFGYQHARATRTAWEAFNEGVGVCRDYTHLGITLCRCMNIPARYCSGYVSDAGQAPPYEPMDFATWFEAYLGGQWHTFDPRNLTPRMGRVLIARGRDAADVPISNAFGPATLGAFKVWADEVGDDVSRLSGQGGV
jgi:transglutaminase-like putative cysteine protease